MKKQEYKEVSNEQSGGVLGSVKPRISCQIQLFKNNKEIPLFDLVGIETGRIAP
jgi:hypothetical protein